MKEKIGIYGSAVDGDSYLQQKAIALGKALSQHDVILCTGAGHGIPYLVATTAKKQNPKIEIWGFPPTTTLEGLQEYMPQADTTIYDKLTYVPKDFAFVQSVGARRQYRNLTSTATVDGGILLAGRWGSMSEFASLREMGKVIGVLTDTGGFADEIQHLTDVFSKETTGEVICNSNPEELVEQVLGEVRGRNL